ncbi:hypothetical protein LOTGIDRAFT_163013 [Lottia gigantea]|uniref:adenosine deaminase n=1 Tax=Lottia gigantea TaxID=225164 RepID=V4A5N4_LOTGI|nr:hypothetical protein LOTGIDRAFT_163013 [Lottia gigantea]ESO92007.1 hypothetical protein LOTGIDRAFT_163013 [Lottia gigantea]
MVVGSRSSVPNAYFQERERFIAQERCQRTGNDITLTEREIRVNEKFMKEKFRVTESSRLNNTIFPPALNFFKTKPLIDASSIFHMIRDMPKGAALHVHSMSIVSTDWLVYNITYRPHCYMCRNSDGKYKFRFFDTAPENSDCPWISIAQSRRESRNVKAFDQSLYDKFSVVISDPEIQHVTVNDVWDDFVEAFTMIDGLIQHAPVFRDYIWEAMKQFQEDNVQYLEIRADLPHLYELDGRTHPRHYGMQIYQEQLNSYRAENPDFNGIKVILAGNRHLSTSEIREDVELAISLIVAYPDLMAGYDLIFQEGKSNPHVYYINELMLPSSYSPPIDLRFFFHSGETNWQGTSIDENLIDAVLLNSTRIGHGFAVTKHPNVLKMVKDRDIAIELNPISNQVLHLVHDLRNHPGTFLIAQNYPVVISSDDPAVWDATPLSHDFYETFMALCGQDDDIRIFKQLALNSIKYSVMSTEEKALAVEIFNQSWLRFINKYA